jgi:hypothetical protein
MVALPLQLGRRRILILVLEKENLVRLQLADPIDLKTDDYFVPQENAAGIELLIAYEEDLERLFALSKSGGIAEVIKHLERGRTIYDGEAVGPPRRLNERKN